MAVQNPFAGKNRGANAGDNQQQETQVETNENVYSPFGSLGQTSKVAQVISQNASAESFNALVKAITDQIAKQKQSIGIIDIVPIPREQHQNLYYSVIAVSRLKDKPLPGSTQNPVNQMVQLLIIESSNDSPRALMIDTGSRGNNFTLERTSEDSYSDSMVTYVRKVLSEHYVTAPETFKFVDPIVVPRSFDPADEQSVRVLAADTSLAVNTKAMTNQPNFEDWNIVATLGRNQDLRLPVSVELVNDRFIKNSLGHPIAADLLVTVSTEFINRNRDRNNEDLNNGEMVDNTLSRAAVNIEFIPASTELLRENERRSRHNRDLEAQVAFVARANLLNVEHGLANTEGTVLFTAASVSELNSTEKRPYSELFVGRRGDNTATNVNFYDIGALNYEANVEGTRAKYGTKIDTTSSDFTPHELGRYLDLVSPRRMAIGMDCPNSGPTAWYTTTYAALARGTKEQEKRARETVIAAAIRLTNGYFEDEFDLKNDPILLDEGQRIWLGQWHDAQGRARDIREYTYLSVANLTGENNPDFIGEWMDAQLNTAVAEDRRMADTLSMLQALTGRNVELFGTGLRVTYHSLFMDALVQGIRKSGAPLVSRSSELGSRFEQRRSTSSTMGNALISSGGFGRATSSSRAGFGRSYRMNSRFN